MSSRILFNDGLPSSSKTFFNSVMYLTASLKIWHFESFLSTGYVGKMSLSFPKAMFTLSWRVLSRFFGFLMRSVRSFLFLVSLFDLFVFLTKQAFPLGKTPKLQGGQSVMTSTPFEFVTLILTVVSRLLLK